MSFDAQDALTGLLARHGIRDRFGGAVAADVARLLADPGLDDPALADLTALPFVTIDNDDSMDLDQALLVERGAGDARYVVRYALADASHYAPPASALFAEALERGASYYLPGRCVPMLPRALSEGLVSLNPGVDRRALLFSIDLDAHGAARRTQVTRARIRSRAKLTYGGVQALYDAPQDSPLAGQPYSESLALLAEVGELRIARGRARGVIAFDRVEAEVTLARGGAALQLAREPRSAASRYNEQISLLCNIEGARLLARGADADAQPVFRVHAEPDPASLAHLERVIGSTVALHGLEADPWRWRRGAQRLADYLARLHAAARPEQLAVLRAIERQILIANRRSEFTAEPGRHFALGVSPYSRFSSPMREVVGIFTHKEALEQLGLARPDGDRAADEALRQRVIAAANRAKERQRRLTKEVFALALDQRFAAELALAAAARPSYRGTIVGLKPTRLYVTVDDPPLDLKIDTADAERALGSALHLAADEPALLRPAQRGAAGLRLGDVVGLRVAARDARGRWHFTLLPDA